MDTAVAAGCCRRSSLTAPSELEFAERSWVAAARRGDVMAFNELVDCYQRLAYGVAFRTLGQGEEAADAVQEAFLSAFRGIRDFRGDSFRAWLLRIVVNACYDQLRRRQRHPSDSLEALGEGASVDFAPDPSPGPEQAALGRETADVIQQLLDELPPDQRLVVVLCDVQGLSYEEVAAATEVAVGTVKSRLSRARTRLRDELAARGELPGSTRRPTHEGLTAP